MFQEENIVHKWIEIQNIVHKWIEIENIVHISIHLCMLFSS